MTRVALRSIRSHLGRFLMSILAVLLGVAFVSGTFALRSMLAGTFDDIVASSAQADAYVRGQEIAGESSGPGGGPGSGLGTDRTSVPLSLLDTVEQVPGVAVATPDVTGAVVLVGADGTAVISGGGAPSFGFGYDPDDPTVSIVAGSAPEGTGEIALESAALEASGLSVGDRTQLVVGGQVQQVTVSGEAHFGAAVAGAIIVLLDQDSALAAWAPDGVVPDIGIYAQDGVDPETLAADVSDALAGQAAAADLEVVTGDVLRAEATEQIRSILGFIGTFLLVFAAIALFVGAFIITNTFQMTVRQRQREFAMLRAVGASPGQVFGSILVQALVVGVLGAVGGVAAGLGLVSVLRVVLAAMGMELSGRVPLDGFTVTVSLLVGALVSLVAAAVPARHAAITPPVEAMREDDVRHEPGSGRWSAAAGAVLFVGGIAAVTVAATGRADDQAGPVLGAGAAGVLIGSLMLAPSLVPGVLSVLAWPSVRAMRPLGGLARGNVTRNPRRTANTAGALMTGMALVGAAAVLAASTQASVRSVVETESTSDLLLQSATFDVPAGAVDDVAALPQVDEALAMRVSQLGIDGVATRVIGAGPALFTDALRVPVIAGDPASMADGEVVVQKAAAEAEGWSVGDTLALTGTTGATDVTIGAVIDSRAVEVDVVVPQTVLDSLTSVAEQSIRTVFLTLQPDVTLADGKAAITDVVKPYLVISVMDNEEFADSLSAQVDQVLVILYALLGLSVVIAVLGIVNTLALSIAERTREVGLLRAVGLGRFQLATVVTIESVLTAVFGTVLGVGIGVGLAASLPHVFADEGLNELVVPWGQLGVFLGLAVVVGVLAAIWPAVRAARMDVLQAISYE